MNNLKIEKVRILTIKPHPKNPREHNKNNIKAIKESLLNYKQMTPVVVGSNDYIIKGCGTWEAMVEMEFEFINIIKATHLTPHEEIAYAIADNKTTDLSGFDYKMLQDIFKDLTIEEFDLSKTSFQEFELKPLLNAEWKPEGKSEKSKSSASTLIFKGDNFLKVKRFEKLFKNKNKSLEDKSLLEIFMIIINIYLEENGPRIIKKSKDN